MVKGIDIKVMFYRDSIFEIFDCFMFVLVMVRYKIRFNIYSLGE